MRGQSGNVEGVRMKYVNVEDFVRHVGEISSKMDNLILVERFWYGVVFDIVEVKKKLKVEINVRVFTCLGNCMSSSPTVTASFRRIRVYEFHDGRDVSMRMDENMNSRRGVNKFCSVKPGHVFNGFGAKENFITKA